jgi:hypothetical protein
MGFSSLAVMANSLLLQFEFRQRVLPPLAEAAPSGPQAAPVAAA